MGRILNSQSTFSLGVNEAGITLSDVITDNVSISMHGFCPKAPNNTSYFLRGDGVWSNAGVTQTPKDNSTKIATTAYVDSGVVIINAQEGFLINGLISVSVASNNITVSIVGMNGSAPSASNPVYYRNNGFIHSITTTISVTVNAGANSFNAGSAELATKEIDYFVYLGYNATDGVTLGFARIPYATCYGDFSATATNEKYCAISSIAHAASTDYYNVIGRFAATLGASATYYWTVPAYTSINLIQRPIFETRSLIALTTATGFSSLPASLFVTYKIFGNQLKFSVNSLGNGTSNATTITFTIPITVSETGWVPCRVMDSAVSSLADETLAQPIFDGVSEYGID